MGAHKSKIRLFSLFVILLTNLVICENSFAQLEKLNSPVYTQFNTFWEMTNILELNNPGTSNLPIEITFYARDGIEISSYNFNLNSKDQRDLILNENGYLTGNLKDEYGTIKISYSPASSPLDGRISLYSMDAINIEPEYAFSLPFSEALVGNTYAIANTFDLERNNTPFPNWVQLSNLEPGSPQSFTVKMYNSLGHLVRTREITLASFERRDIQAGHEENEYDAFLIEIIPNNQSAKYLASLSRYGVGDSNKVVSFGSLQLFRKPEQDKQYTLITNESGNNYQISNWVEIANTTSTVVNATLEFFDRNGQAISNKNIQLGPKAQHHYPIYVLLENSNQIGSVKISPSIQNSLISNSAVYYFDSLSNSLLSAFIIPAFRGSLSPLSGSYNSYLEQQNEVIAISSHNSNIPAELNIRSQTNNLNLSPSSASSQAINPSSNEYGTFDISPISTFSRMLSYGLRKKLNADGSIAFVHSTLTRNTELDKAEVNIMPLKDNVITKGQYQINWQSNPHASSYEISIGVLPDCSDNLFSTTLIGSASSFSIPFLVDGSYHLCITGTNKDNYESSDDVNFDVDIFPLYIVQENPSSNFSNIAGHVGLDPSGNIILVNSFNGSADFTRGSGSSTASAGESDLFFAKYDRFGALVNHVTIGDTGNESVNFVSYDSNGNFAVMGRFFNTVDFDPSPSSSNTLTADSDGDTFLAVYNYNFELQWLVKYSSSSSYPYFNDILLASDGSVYTNIRIAGTYDFDPTSGVHSLSSYGYNDGFMSRIDGNGNYQWTHQFSGAGSDGEMGSMYESSDGSIAYSTSSKGGSDLDPSSGSSPASAHGNADSIYTVVNPDKSWTGIGGIVGGSAYDYTNSISRDSSGNVILGGMFMSTNFDVDPRGGNTQSLSKPSTGWDLYAAKFDPSGNVLWAHSWGGAGDQFNWDASQSTENYLFMRGTYSNSFDVDFDSSNITSLTSLDSGDAFLTIIDKDGKHVKTLNVSSLSGSDNILSFKKDNKDLWVYGYAGDDASLSSFGSSKTFKGGFVMPIFNVFP